MSSFQSRVWSQQQFAYVPHSSVSGDTWQCVRQGVTDGAGSTTTLVDSTLGMSDDFFNGYYWVEMLTGSAAGQWKRITDYVSSSGTCTFEGTGMTAATGSGSEYRIWLSPEPVVVATTGGTLSATQCNDDTRDEADTFWPGYYIVPISGTLRGEAPKLISAFDASGGATEGLFTFAAFSGAMSGGDVFLLRKFIEPGDLSAGPSHEYIPRPMSRVNFSMGDGVLGPRSASVSFSTQIRPSGTAPANGTSPGLSNVAGLFQAAGLEEQIDTSDLVDDLANGDSDQQITVDAASSFTVGNMFGWDGNYSFVRTLNTSTQILTPAVRFDTVMGDSTGAWGDGGGGRIPDDDTIQACRMYYKSTDGDGMYGVTIEWEMDGVRYTFTGCKGNVTFNDAPAPTLNWELQADHWIREINAAPYTATGAYSTVAPVLSQDRKCYIGATGSETATNIAGFTATPGSQMAPRPIQGAAGINGRSGFQIIGYQAGCTFRELMDSSITTLPQEVRWLLRTGVGVFVVYSDGTNAFGVFLRSARHIESPHPTDEGGLASVPIVMGAQDAGMDTTTATTKVPDFAFCIT